MPETEIETIRIYVLVFLWFTQILEMYFSGGLKIGVCYYCYIIWYAVCPPAKWSTRETVYSCRPPFIIQKFSALSHVTNSICFVSYLFYTSICIRIVLFMYVRVILFCFNFSYIAFFHFKWKYSPFYSNHTYPYTPIRCYSFGQNKYYTHSDKILKCIYFF